MIWRLIWRLVVVNMVLLLVDMVVDASPAPRWGRKLVTCAGEAGEVGQG